MTPLELARFLLYGRSPVMMEELTLAHEVVRLHDENERLQAKVAQLEATVRNLYETSNA